MGEPVLSPMTQRNKAEPGGSRTKARETMRRSQEGKGEADNRGVGEARLGSQT
jgi:hypothetical protein